MLSLHRGKFVDIKWVKIPSLTALQVAKYMRTVNNMYEPLKLVSATFYQIFIFPPSDSYLKIMKNVFCFI